MIKTVVVNDCAFVMHDLKPYLETDFDVQMIRRSRHFLSKTVGLFFKILFSKGDLYHVSYALQDAWLVQRMKRVDVLHVHGSDVRTTLNNKKLGWIVRNNLLLSRKVIYSTPDLEPIVCKIRADAEYFPTPVDTDRFKPKNHYYPRPQAVYFHKPYEQPNKKIVSLLGKNKIMLYPITKKIPYSDMPLFLRMFDIFIDQTTIPALSKTCLEAMSCGLATIDYRDLDKLETKIEALTDVEKIKKLGVRNRGYVFTHHNVMDRAYHLKEIWNELI